ncbi:phage late control D family protein [Persephonella sp.]
MSVFTEKYNGFKVPQLKIFINDREIDPKKIRVSEVEIDLIRNGAGSFRFIVSEAIDQNFNIRFEELISFGNSVEILLGYEDTLLTVIKGFISTLNYSFEEENYLDIEVEGFDNLFLMTRKKQIRSWSDHKISDVVNIITEDYPFDRRDIETTDLKFEYIRQNGISDLQFLKELAEKSGFEFFVDNNVFHFRKPAFNRSPDLSLEFGVDLFNFKPTLDVSDLFEEVSVSGWDYRKKTSESYTASGGKTKGEGTLILKNDIKTRLPVRFDTSLDSYDKIESLANSIFTERSLNFVKADLTSSGIPDIKPGSVVKLTGVGSKFSGNYYVEKVLHRFISGSFSTRVELRGNVI